MVIVADIIRDNDINTMVKVQGKIPWTIVMLGRKPIIKAGSGTYPTACEIARSWELGG
ncbi:MAG: hypothetical protein ACI4I6_07425 [Hominimerdicola sp.]